MELLNDQDSVSKLLQAHTHVWNHMFNFINSMSLKYAVQLDIPDAIHSHGRQPMTISQLVAALPIHPGKAYCVHRLMRILVHSGFFAMQRVGANHEEEGYLLTESSRLLLKDHPFSMRPLVLLALDPILTKPYQYMCTWLQNDDLTAFSVAHGEKVWEFAGHEPGFNHAFNDAMAIDSALVGALVISKNKELFEGLESLVDVGGGTGNMAKAIAETFPHLDCTVLDLPHVVAGLQGSKNLKYLAGDMLESIPSTDAILLKWILHNWGDEGCLKVLKNCREAITREGKGGGKVIIIDMVIGNQSWDEKSIETQLFMDMQMMVCFEGRERTEQEWAKLFSDAGFRDYKINPILGVRALIEVYP